MLSFGGRPRPVTSQSGTESGFTVLEVMIASAIMLLVMASFFGILVSLTNTERRTNALVSNEQDARFVLTALARDIRSANPMEPFTTSKTEYQSKIQLKIGTPGSQTTVRWLYDTNTASATYRTLSRQIINPANGAVTSTVVRLRNIRNVDLGVPLFSYYSQSGNDLVTGAGSVADVGNCAIQVHIRITADSNPGPQPFTVNSDVQLRNRLPGGVGCG